ncbi:MAG TPA: tetratricopeptide repeat protein, partial [Chitinophagaceae bacterium]|nr:tetratricopeptide repeat protein [Chitinophagaceae bacterium]
MKKYNLFYMARLAALFLLLTGALISGWGQSVDSLKATLSTAKDDTLKVETLLQISALLYGSTDPNAAIPYAEQAKELSSKLNYPRGVAYAYKYIGLVHYQQSRNVEAMDNWNKSLEVFESINDKAGIANMLGNIGVIYKDQGNDAKALEYFFGCLKGSEEAGDQLRYTIALNNIGSVYQHKKATYDKALEYYLKALPASIKLKDSPLTGVITANLGEIYLDRGNSDSALYYFEKLKQIYHGTADIPYALYNIGKAFTQRKEYALALQYQQQAYDSAVALNSEQYQLYILKGIADVYANTNQHRKALDYYLKGEALSKKLNSTYDLKNNYEGVAASYAKLSDYGKAYKYQQLLIGIKDTIYTKEADLKLANYEFNFEIEKKEGQIGLLEKDKDLQAANIKRQKIAKNAFIGGFTLILVIAFIIYRNYRAKVRTSKILDKQKNEIENLLLNILPAEVAHELQLTGQSTPRHYENVSVM